MSSRRGLRGAFFQHYICKIERALEKNHVFNRPNTILDRIYGILYLLESINIQYK